MASSKPSCDPCSSKELSLVLAIKYCTDCAENLCMDCWNAHSSFKALSSHHIIDSGSLSMDTLSVTKLCTNHEDMALDFFCVDHDCLCCRSCMAEAHRGCQKVVPVDVASKGVQKSYMLEDTFSTVSTMRGTLEKLISNRDENLKSLHDEEAGVLRNVSGIKTKILERLDDLEKKVLSQLKSSRAKCENQINSDKDILSKMMESLEDITGKLDLVSKHGSENQIFILLNSYKRKVSDYKVRIQEMIRSMFTSKIAFKQSPQQEDVMESLGSIRITSTPCPMKYQASKTKQAQVLPTTKQAQVLPTTKQAQVLPTRKQAQVLPTTKQAQVLQTTTQAQVLQKTKQAQDLPTTTQAHVLPTTIQMPTNFEFDFKFDNKYTNYVRITSIAVTDDNRLLICNRESTKLQLYSDRGEYIQGCTLSGKPRSIAVIPGEEKAVVSLENAIQFVDIKAMKSGRTHYTRSSGYIAVVGDKICVGGGYGGQIWILNKQGKNTTTITLPDVSWINYLHPGPQDSVYYTGKDTVGCVKLSGEVRFTYKPENFNGAKAVITDMGGNLYVACSESNNIHRLSADGNVIDIILDNEKNISQPNLLAFSRNYRNFFVTNDNGMSVFVFSCW